MIKALDILKTEEAKENFLKALIRVAKCDHIVKDSEKQYFYSAAQSLGMTEAGVASLADYWGDTEIKVYFSTKQEGIFALMQIVQLCWIDDEYVETEKEEVRKIATEIGVSFDAVQKIEDWVLRGMEWTLEGDKLLDLE